MKKFEFVPIKNCNLRRRMSLCAVSVTRDFLTANVLRSALNFRTTQSAGGPTVQT